MENWKPYKYIYDISDYGRLRNRLTGKILKPRKNSNGYLIYSGSGGKRGVYINISIHRAVAELFIDNINNLPQVNHIDGNKLNNVYTNLEWCSASDNMEHNFNIGLSTPVKNTITQEQIQIIQELYGKASSRHVAKLAKCSHGTVQKYWKMVNTHDIKENSPCRNQ